MKADVNDEVRGEKGDAPRPDGDGDDGGTPPTDAKNETTTSVGSLDGSDRSPPALSEKEEEEDDDRLVDGGTIPTTSALRDDDDEEHDDEDQLEDEDDEEYDDDQLDEHDDQLIDDDDDDDDDAEGTILFERGGASKSTPPLFSTVDEDEDGEDDENRRRLFLSARNLEDLLQEHRANEGASYYPDPDDDDDRGRDDDDLRVDDDKDDDHHDNNDDDEHEHDITPAEEEVRAELRKLSPHMFAGNAEMWRARAQRMGVRRITVANDADRDDRCRETTSAPALPYYACAFRPRGVDDDDDEFFHEEYLRPASSEFLRRVYAGFSRGTADAAVASVAATTDAEERVGRAAGCATPAALLSRRRSSSPPPPREPVPLRTVALRVRPDALCGTVMDALSYVATTERRGEMIKRQGGHVVVVVPGAWLRRRRRDAVDDDVDRGRGRRRRRRRVFLPPLWLDARLCTRRRGPSSRTYERTLVLRLYDLEDAPAGDAAGEYTREFGKIRRDEVVKERYADPRDALREASHVVRRMVSAERDETRRGDNDDDAQADDDRAPSSPALWSKLLTSPTRLFHGHEPHSRRGSAFSNDATPRHEPFPSLSSDNDLFLEGSFRFLVALSSELDARGLSYDSLRASTFGAFPALPTLDAHYCSQTRLVCRERMLEDLLRAAADMERTAREAEARSAVFVRTLGAGSVHPTQPPSTPTPTSLTEYELDFEPPEASCPPWGRRVMEALQRIAADTSERNAADAAAAAAAAVPSPTRGDEGADEEKKEPPRVAVAAANRDGEPSDGFERAAAAVRSVVDAFSAQDDEERTARIDRKRRQVADRVARASATARQTMIRTRDSYGCNAAATKAADHFHSMALRAKDLGSCLDPDDDASSSSSSRRRRPAVSFAAPDQVPLLTCPVIVGEAAGTCHVTAHQILFATNHVAFLPTRKRVVSISNLELVPGEPDPRGGRRLFRPPPEAVLTIRLHKNLGRLRGDSTTTTAGETEEEGSGFVSVVEEEVLSFVPSLGAERFKRFVDTVKSIGAENDDDDDDDR